MDDGLLESAAAARRQIRQGTLTGPTTGLAPGYIQGNVVILPRAWAGEFEAFCRANAKACPVLAVSEPGEPSLPTLGDIDIRHDLPRYRVHRHGVVDADPTDVADLWRDDLVTFVLGCSFTFEHPLIEAGIPLRHIAQGLNVSMYKTSLKTVPVGRWHGPMVVSMRPLTPADADRAATISGRFPDMHGAPVHRGDPASIGIRDIAAPDYGDPVAIEPGEIPVFWACGVTPQAAIEVVRPEFCITHAPGCMLITDLKHGRA
ncbi:MAG TPA: putative hydro-lyase [Aliidongia sp.]|uniref:putative hydro-lyase n=1 Tax=Aliidongia sp. TaxID=1914230 RepID=UPI002DDC976F|nr:putative hydro-lyase [Aliidongia sp.]HEV2674233.1 putative hydro-lyase [Aliidongia sp.]